MTQITIQIAGAEASAKKSGALTAGMVGVPVAFTFGSAWDGLAITAVFAAGTVKKDLPLTAPYTAAVPHEVLASPGQILYIGAEGRSPDGALVIPTTWARVGTILEGAQAVGDPGLAPTPSQYDRLLALTAQARQTADAALEKSVPADWNAAEGEPGHVLNRTHWTESKGMVQLPVSVQWGDEDGDGEHDGGFLTASLGLVIGDTYTVKWGGVEYTCVAQGAGEDDFVTPVLGDLYAYTGGAMGSASTGEPFVILDPGVEIGDGVYGIIIGLDGICDEAFTIYHVDETVHKLPNKYLDLEWLPTSKAVEILPETNVAGTQKLTGFSIIGRDSVTLVIDGVAHTCSVIFQTASELGETNDGYVVVAGSIFLMQFVNGDTRVVCNVLDGNSHTLSILATEYNKMPAEFLPESVDGVVIRSSTPDSTKTFKLTVDDSGAVTATEV